MRCLSCKYDLSHLTEHRCPECGREFDPNDPWSFDAEPVKRVTLGQCLTTGVVAIFLIALAGFFVLPCIDNGTFPSDKIALVVPVPVFGIGSAILLRHSR